MRRIIPQLWSHGFDDIFVLDDASTDGSVSFLERQRGITLVKGETNLGPVGNRNRIMAVATREIILFADADMELTGPSTAAAVEREFAQHPDIAAVGPLYISLDGRPESRCWGYDFSPMRAGVTYALCTIARQHGNDPNVMATVRQLAHGRVAGFEPLASRNVDWVRESFFAVRAAVFNDLGGFDTGFRMFHEGPDLCRRIRQAGWAVRFTTDIIVRNANMMSGTADQRAADEQASDIYYFNKHYGVSEEQLRLLLS